MHLNFVDAILCGMPLSPKEAVKVYFELDTNRILGFTPEFAKPLFPMGIRYKEQTLQSAREIERHVGMYRQQQERDAYEATVRQIQRESIFRKSLASAIRARNLHVNPLNRDLNNTLIRLMDEKYDRMMQAKLRPQVYTPAEAYEQGKTAHEVALDSPYFKHGPEKIADGGAVEGE
jgi:hypothetical protein